MQKFFLRIISILFGIGLIYIGGWKIGLVEQNLFLESQDLIFNKTAIAIRIDQYYFGLFDIHRFFNSPVISWIFLILGLFLFISWLFIKNQDIET